MLFSLIYFFGSFCVHYFPHNYVISQAMSHAIPLISTHSAFYPHRLSPRLVAATCGLVCYDLEIMFRSYTGKNKECVVPSKALSMLYCVYFIHIETFIFLSAFFKMFPKG